MVSLDNVAFPAAQLAPPAIAAARVPFTVTVLPFDVMPVAPFVSRLIGCPVASHIAADVFVT